jgi:hypothetical protein
MVFFFRLAKTMSTIAKSSSDWWESHLCRHLVRPKPSAQSWYLFSFFVYFYVSYIVRCVFQKNNFNSRNEEYKSYIFSCFFVIFIEPYLILQSKCFQAKKGKVYAVGTEDMDALTFGSTVLLRHLTFSEARKMPIKEFHHDKVIF